MNKLHPISNFKTLGCLSIFWLCNFVNIHAQSGSIDSSFYKKFDTFNTTIQQDFTSFRHHNDSLFLQFLTQSWKEYNAVENNIPDFPKPVETPIYKAPVTPDVPKPDTINQQQQGLQESSPGQKSDGTEDQPKSGQLSDDQVLPLKTEPIPESAAFSKMEPMAKLEYYGTDFNIPSVTQGIPVLTTISKEGIVKYFASASVSSVLNNVAITLQNEAANYKLNDWGLANLFMKAAQKMYPRHIDQVMFTWFALLRSNFNVKTGYNYQNVYLLLPSNEMLYEMSFYVNGRQYYLLNFGTAQAEPEHLTIHEGNYPASIAGLTFLITQTPELTNRLAKRNLTFNRSLELQLNKNLIDFYSVYPRCELKVFFKAPLSANAINQLDSFFLPALENKKDDDDRVAILLRFVQDAIPYKTDKQQFGHEKYLFADETLYYPAADCEDRAVLLAKLINRYTSCKAIGLIYPTHVSLAVNLTSLHDGKFLTYKNLKYFHCDPTYLGAACGIPMPGYENAVPKIIDYDM